MITAASPTSTPAVHLAPRPSALACSYGALLAVLLLQIPVVLRRAINWDEFFHYSQVERLAHGTLTGPLQTLYTRAFVWTTDLPGTGVDHVIVIRLFMLACELVTIAAIIAMASRFTDRTTGVLCALAYVSGGFVFRHGTSFRFDPPAAALLMSALWVLLCRPPSARWLVLAGVLIGTAGMSTIKSVLYAPAFVGVMWLQWNGAGRSRAYLLKAAGIALTAAATFGGLYLLHSVGLGNDAGEKAATVVSTSSEKMFSLGIQPYWPYIPIAATLAPLTAVLVLLVPFLLWRSKRPAAERVALAGLYLPLSTLLFYHNTAPYYYVFMLAPVAVACVVPMRLLADRYGAKPLAALFVVNATFLLVLEPKTTLDSQREIQSAADDIFGGPVAYFDANAMLGRYPKANAFMTPWGVELYKKGLYPSFRETMTKQAVPLVLDDELMFGDVLNSREADANFLPSDLEAIRANYVHFWGPFWLAGKSVRGGAPERTEQFLVPGSYTVRDGAITVDGKPLEPGQIVELARGTHRIKAGASQGGRLIWGKRLKEPAYSPPTKPYWEGF